MPSPFAKAIGTAARAHVCLLVVVTSVAATGAPCAMLPTRLTVDYIPAPAPLTASALARVSDRAAPLLGWWISSLQQNQSQSAYQIQVASDAQFSRLLWESGKVNSSDQSAIPYGGPRVPSRSTVWWRVSLWDASNTPCGSGSEVGAWEVGLPTEEDWFGAQWITREAPHPPIGDCEWYSLPPAPLFRTDFIVTANPILKARLYITGLGYFKPYISGTRIGDAELDPGWSVYNVSTYYSVFDVTDTVSVGSGTPRTHTLGIALGNGWWNMPPLRFWGSKKFRDSLPTGDPILRALLTIQHSDGGLQMVQSSFSNVLWPWTVGPSATLSNSIHLGTSVDRRSEPVGWSSPGFVPSNPSAWTQPFSAPAASLPATLVVSSLPPVRRQAAVTPVGNHSSAPGVLVLDVGRNIAGVCEFCMRSGTPAGTNFTFRYGELLYKNGSLNGMTSVAGQIKSGNGGPCAPHIAWQLDYYTARGDAGGECFTPEWTWHGFRYVEVTGSGAAAAWLDNATCYPLRSDISRNAAFASSNPLLNAIHEMEVHTAENNMMSVQSDCPARERLGYGGDALMSGESIIANFDAALFYEKRVRDYFDAQRANGGFTETAPFVGIADNGLGGDTGPIGWQAFVPAALTWLYKYYGNMTILSDTFDSLLAYGNFLAAQPESAIQAGLGDWMAIENKALGLTGLGFQHISYAAIANISDALGQHSVAAQWRARAATIADRINALYLNPTTGVYSGPGWNATQCGQAMPLFLQITPPNATAAALSVLAGNVVSNGGHLAVGAFGMKYLLQVLGDAGRADLAYGVMNTNQYPSYGYMLDGNMNGLTNATTVWESWFTSDDTYSHDHPMFTSGEVYLFQSLAGIQVHPSAQGYDAVLIKPLPPPYTVPNPLTFVNATQTTVRGVVSANWTLSSASGVFHLEVALPPNMRGEVWMPPPGVRVGTPSMSGGNATAALRGERISVGSGRHVFEVRL